MRRGIIQRIYDRNYDDAISVREIYEIIKHIRIYRQSDHYKSDKIFIKIIRKINNQRFT